MAVCPQCSQENPDGARFCNACGSPLAGETEPGREVRKTVTVVFCDVVGSTALGERFDPEVLREMMARFYAAARAPVERYGGTVEKVIGDALVAVFGIPIVHEDDALRAVRAALEMRDAVRMLGDVQARIGVNTGDVLARESTRLEALIVGDAVNIAARLEQAAGPGEVLVGEATWALIGHAAQGEPVPPVAAKGKERPLAAWRLEAVDPAAGGHRRRLDLPMVGREQELDLVRLVLRRARDSQRPHLVTVLGQAGIGKSRLVSEVGRLGAGLTVLTGHCRASGQSSSLEPLLEAARSAAAGGPDAAADLERLMEGDPDAAAAAALLAGGGTPGAPDVSWATSRLLGAISESGVALVLEDVHWADDLLLDVVDQLMADRRRRSLIVVCTARPEFAERRPGWGSGGNAFTIALDRLDGDQTRLLLQHAAQALSADQVDRIVDAAEGNPLFAEHMAALVGAEDEGGHLPRSIQVLLTARVEALPEAERELLAVAAVVGRAFPVGAVEALAGRPVDDELARLEQRELLEPAAPGRRQFTHALLQEAAYGLSSKGRRSDLHVAVARWLSDQGVDDAAIGDHLERAYRLRVELGRDDAETAALREQAGARLAAAGRRADAQGDPVRAKRLLSRALELLPFEGPAYAAALVEFAAAAWNLLPAAELNGLLERGAELAARHGLRALELRAVILRMGGLPQSHPDWLPESAMIDIASAAVDELETLGDPRALATALCTLADAEKSCGRAGVAAELARRGLDAVRTAGEDAVWAIQTLTIALRDSPTPAGEVESTLTALTDEFGARPTVRFQLLLAQVRNALVRGDRDRAATAVEAAEQLKEELGGRGAWRLRNVQARVALYDGDHRAAIDAFTDVIVDLESVGFGLGAGPLLAERCIAEVAAGDLQAARASAAAALTIAERVDDYECSVRARLALSAVALAEEDPGTAVALAAEAAGIAATGDWVLLQAATRVEYARALAARGDTDAAAAEARAARSISQAKGDVTGVAAAERLLGTLP